VIEPVRSPTAMETIDGAAGQEAAGSPLDPSFEQQKAIMPAATACSTPARTARRPAASIAC
jgi:hypothetical protein